jgi:glutamate N-acetyltransferase/amino-acid N-acetyltransferase
MRAAGISAGFRKNPERKDMALVVADKTCVCAATFTQNRFCAAPVQVSRARAASGHARAVVLNSGNANAATGEPGLRCAEKACALVAHELGCDEKDVLVASTGVIGVQLPFEPYVTGVPAIVDALAPTPEAAHDAACAVMTTDTHPKEVAFAGSAPQTGGNTVTVHVGGFAKGSGMIQPNMATMLCALSTDAPLTPEAARAALLSACAPDLQQGDSGLRHFHKRHLHPLCHRRCRRRRYRRGVSCLPGGGGCHQGGVHQPCPPDCR